MRSSPGWFIGEGVLPLGFSEDGVCTLLGGLSDLLVDDLGLLCGDGVGDLLLGDEVPL